MKYIVQKYTLDQISWLKEKQKEAYICELKHWQTFIAGGVGGFFAWFVSYPQDVIKTMLQV